MRTNPFSDVLDLLTEGEWISYVFALLVLASVGIAAVNLWCDASQRSVLHLWNWLVRLFLGGLWWQQSLWKLPPPYTDNPDGLGGLRYWIAVTLTFGLFSRPLMDRSFQCPIWKLRNSEIPANANQSENRARRRP
jgi:hypothetical protein